MPDAEEAAQEIKQLFAESNSALAVSLSEVILAKDVFIYMPFAACIISLVYLYLLKCIAKPLIYVSIFSVLIVLVGAGYFAWI